MRRRLEMQSAEGALDQIDRQAGLREAARQTMRGEFLGAEGAREEAPLIGFFLELYEERAGERRLFKDHARANRNPGRSGVSRSACEAASAG
jgi:hypothetical protein